MIEKTADELGLVHAVFDSWNARHGPDGPARRATISACLHPEAEWKDPPDWPDANVYRGVDAVLATLEQTADILGVSRIEVTDTTALGDAVLVEVAVHTAVEHGALSATLPFFYLMHFEDERIRSVQAYTERQQALEE